MGRFKVHWYDENDRWRDGTPPLSPYSRSRNQPDPEAVAIAQGSDFLWPNENTNPDILITSPVQGPVTAGMDIDGGSGSINLSVNRLNIVRDKKRATLYARQEDIEGYQVVSLAGGTYGARPTFMFRLNTIKDPFGNHGQNMHRGLIEFAKYYRTWEVVHQKITVLCCCPTGPNQYKLKNGTQYNSSGVALTVPGNDPGSVGAFPSARLYCVSQYPIKPNQSQMITPGFKASGAIDWDWNKTKYVKHWNTTTTKMRDHYVKVGSVRWSASNYMRDTFAYKKKVNSVSVLKNPSGTVDVIPSNATGSYNKGQFFSAADPFDIANSGAGFKEPEISWNAFFAVTPYDGGLREFADQINKYDVNSNNIRIDFRFKVVISTTIMFSDPWDTNVPFNAAAYTPPQATMDDRIFMQSGQTVPDDEDAGADNHHTYGPAGDTGGTSPNFPSVQGGYMRDSLVP